MRDTTLTWKLPVISKPQVEIDSSTILDKPLPVLVLSSYVRFSHVVGFHMSDSKGRTLGP